MSFMVASAHDIRFTVYSLLGIPRLNKITVICSVSLIVILTIFFIIKSLKWTKETRAKHRHVNS